MLPQKNAILNYLGAVAGEIPEDYISRVHL